MAGGELVGDDVEVAGGAIDSRALVPGQLFVPVVGERDGHDFIEAALDAGAAAYLTTGRRPGGTAVVVEDTTEALQLVGRAVGDRLGAQVVGITGSVGKTTVKDMAAAAARPCFVTGAAYRSHNNELGVPLTLLNAPADAALVITEMGARGHGHIAQLAAIARPTIGVVTNVRHAHTELLGDLDDVARAKGELVEHLPASGTAVLAAHDERVTAMASLTDAQVVTFGEGGDVRAEDVRLDDRLHARFTVVSPWGRAPVGLGVPGRHQVDNALAAVTAVVAAGGALDDVAAGLGDAVLSPWRMELERTAQGALVLNDAYNANPASMAAALAALAELDAERRFAVVGVMAELGEHSPALHREVVEAAERLGVVLVVVGTDEYGVAPVDDLDAAEAALGPLGEGDAVLVKGSRVAGLERLAERLVGR